MPRLLKLSPRFCGDDSIIFVGEDGDVSCHEVRCAVSAEVRTFFCSDDAVVNWVFLTQKKTQGFFIIFRGGVNSETLAIKMFVDGEGCMRVFSYLILLIIILIGLTFASLNSEIVVFNYYVGSKNIALSLLLVCALGAGIFLGLLVAVFPWIKIKRDSMRLRSRLKVVEKEVENLRSIPIKGD